MDNKVTHSTGNDNNDLVKVLVKYPSRQHEEWGNTIERKVTKKIEDIMPGNIAYISLTNEAKEGDIVLLGELDISERLEMCNNQTDIIGTVKGHYIHGRFV